MHSSMTADPFGPADPSIELELTAGERVLAARRSGSRAGVRVLALHGWLDNAMSFAPLAAQLPEFDFVSLDLSGHGHSAHRPPHCWYHFIDYLDDVLLALDALHWDECILLGHSLGGAVASVLAASHPQRVQRLLLIEALGPMGFRPGSAVGVLRTAFSERRAADGTGKSPRVFEDPEQVTALRMQAGNLSHAAAKLLVQRNLMPVPGGYSWRSDPRLRIASPLRIHEELILEWLSAIECPTLLIAAEPSPPYFDEATRTRRIASVRELQQIVLRGNHHLHMENPLAIATSIRTFLSNCPR